MIQISCLELLKAAPIIANQGVCCCSRLCGSLHFMFVRICCSACPLLRVVSRCIPVGAVQTTRGPDSSCTYLDIITQFAACDTLDVEQHAGLITQLTTWQVEACSPSDRSSFSGCSSPLSVDSEHRWLMDADA